jgi:four helix bundle protein
MREYKKLIIWQDAHRLTLNIYSITNEFPKHELFGITNQLRRSSSSIAANIAEGCSKNSNKDFKHSLSISIGSLNETEYFILLSFDLKYISETQYELITKLIEKLKAQLITFNKKIENV